MIDPHKERAYKEALDIANKPLSVLQHVKDGTLTPENLKHFNSMYPELHDHLNKKITEKITQMQVDDERPTYKVRQGLSMFMGTPLDSTFTPANMQAAQSVFAPKPAAQQNLPAQGKNKKGTSTLSKAAENYQTSTQAAEARQRQ